ncbi:helicase-related protein [Succinivibrio sp.]|uniref:helicase-related protein n=1 Tax=Succinivibrio sp. TaxID=2053619 RepID=UPI0025E1AC92|nr:helicase-related protein [Succinivibrio sp.]MBQ9221170.1 hypothetical protein [Succinivibrio sp.]
MDSKDTRREQLVDIVKREFIGPDVVNDCPELVDPTSGEEILISDPPHKRYIAGILYPKDAVDIDEVDMNSENNDEFYEEIEDTYEIIERNKQYDNADEASKKNEQDDDTEELINLSNAYRQSAISLTAAIHEGDEVSIFVSCGTYELKKETITKTDDKKDQKLKENELKPLTINKYYRHSLEWNNSNKNLTFPTESSKIISYAITDNKDKASGLKFCISFRYKNESNSCIYTFTLLNDKTNKGCIDENCFFQVQFCLKSKIGFSFLPEITEKNEDEDQKANRLLYRNIHNYAIGHGCSVDWEFENQKVKSIYTSILPSFEIKPIVPNNIKGIDLNMFQMGPNGNFDETIKTLEQLCLHYENWIKKLEIIKNNQIDKNLWEQADKHIALCRKCNSRMRGGIELLKTQPKVKIAFQYMNLAMLLQQQHSKLPLQKWKAINSDLKPDTDDGKMKPSSEDKKTWWYGTEKTNNAWRPFQIAFILINLQSMFDKKSHERKIIDLIWFPTGGGKTEAYLGLTAYTIFIRRLLENKDNYTAVIMRYTLRLLTAQQYSRAASLICACEILRKTNENIFGTNRFTIGLWVGRDTTPNTVTKAIDDHKKMVIQGQKNPFVLLKCPWCGAQMGLVEYEEKKGKKREKNNREQLFETPGYRVIQIAPKKKDFAFICRNINCDFSNENFSLPLYVIDEHIYKNSPTVLIGTVDKFATLPFKYEAQRIFGLENGERKSAPDLIIQDELHLISGPLGSMVGMYETMISELCSFTDKDNNKIFPKIIASTATISRAREQCNSLFGCDKNNVIQFPPLGVDAGDSFFAKEDTTKKGRQYVGIFATNSSSDDTTAIRLYSALLFGAKSIKVNKDEDRDPYWTNIGYYNSIRELGLAATWIHADIEQQLDVIYKRRRAQKKYSSQEEYKRNRRYIFNNKELTSRISSSEVTSFLASLETPYKPDKFFNNAYEKPIDICLATNMISVGLDVSRLGLMTVAGQPKTTSEYIQATSRVGRNNESAPGIVFVLYRPGRPRDRSYYEHFRAYHEKLYSNVEPTSVTPYAIPVRKRALHAVVIGLMRLLGKNEEIPEIDKKLEQLVSKSILDRVEQVDPEERIATQKEVKRIYEKWREWVPKVWSNAQEKDNNTVALLNIIESSHINNQKKQGFPTQQSMRSVDCSCEIEPMINSLDKED